MSLNFDTYPYYDDFDPQKNFHRILFKPGYAVQARELTQSQTILQNQISEFASAIYSQNTPVSGGQVTTNLSCYYLKLNPTFNGASVTAANFANQVIFDAETGTILARVIATAETTSSGTSAGDPPTLIVTYLSGGQFTDGLTIQTTGETTYYASIAASVPAAGNYSTGLSSTASIANGVFYIVNGYNVSQTNNQTYSIGNFVDVANQTIILDKYDNTPSYRIGLQLTETIYDYVNDASLLDPAIGASNFQAPGADRYVLSLSLVNLPLTLGNDQNFIELVRIVNGQIINQVDGTVYSTIDDYFAKRDYETNGDYIVNDFSLTPSANSLGVSANYDLTIGKGVAYVHGYRIENQSQKILTNQRARQTNTIIEDAIYVDYANYITIDTAGGIFDIGQVPQVTFHCVGAAGISSPTNGASANSNTYNSTVVGTGFLRNLQYVSGSGANTKAYVYNAYISDFSANTLSGVATNSSTATTLVINDAADTFSTTANAYYGVSITATTGAIVDVRTVTGYSVSGATKTFTVSSATPFTVTPTTSTSVTLNYNTTDISSIVIANSNYYLTANANININGRTQGLPTGGTVVNGFGSPELIFPLGYSHVANVSGTSYYSTRVYRNKTFTGNTLTLSATSGNSGSPLRFEGPTSTQTGTVNQQNFIVINTATGNIIDFTSSGNTITISSDHTAATLTTSGYPTGMTVDVIAQVQVSSGDSSNFVLKSKNLVSGNTLYGSSSMTTVTSTASVDLTKGQTLIGKAAVAYGSKMSLYVNDIKKIAKVYDTGTTGASISGVALSSFTDVTNYYTLDNGQRDNFYDFGSVSLIPGAPLPSGNILVVYNYYSHTQASSGDGYFSIQSYQSSNSTYGGVSTSPESYAQIPVYTAKDGNVYRLSDCIDFRPARQNGQTAYIWEYSSGSQPTGTSDIGVLIPQNLTNFQSNYGYYLGRQDRLVLTKDKSFQIIQGNPAVNPTLPSQPTGSLLLANLLHDPYTAYVPGEGPAGAVSNLSINKVLHKRWAKTDITDLETRINNLEYYTTLSQLEAAAASTQVTNLNGVTRPNYGILVDSFNSYSTADTNNPDYLANINVRTNTLTPLAIVDNFQLQNPVAVATVGTLANTNTYNINNVGSQTYVFTLPYTTANIATQPLASSAVSVNPFSVVIQQGLAHLTPPMDNWVDNTQAPALLVTDPSMQVYQATGGVNLTNSGDFATIPGTSSVTSSSVSVVNHGSITNSPYGATIGYTATTTQTYASQIQNTSASPYNPVSSTFGTNNGYLTNINILPYIRPQQIIVQASGLLVNTPLSTWFDGVNIDKYMTAPNTIELTGISGTFNPGDIVGFNLTVSGTTSFYPVARVISVYNYPNGTQTRLYVADLIGFPGTIGTAKLQNAFFDVNGKYVNSTASGTVSSNSVISINAQGQIGGVGGGYTVSSNGASYSGNLVIAPTNSAYCSFLNQYGVWGDSNQSSTYTANLAFQSTTSGTYTFTASADNNAQFYLNGTLLFQVGSGSGDGNRANYSQTTTFTSSLTSNTTYAVSWTAFNTGGPAAVGLLITDPAGNNVFDSRNPPTLTYNNPGQEIPMPGGGVWFTGVTQVNLGPSASNVANYYVGSKITINSQQVYQQAVASTYTPPTPAPSGGGGSGGWWSWSDWF
jgi:hypothetical protein